MLRELINTQWNSNVFENMQKLENIFLLNVPIFLAMLSWQPWASVRIRAPFTTELWALVFTFPYFPAAAHKQHATFIYNPTNLSV